LVERTESMRAGLSGARLWRLWLRVGAGGAAESRASRVVKLLTPNSSWLTTLAADVRLREIQLRATGLLEDLPNGIESGALTFTIVGPSESPSAGALLLRDERAHLLHRPFRTPPGSAPAMLPLLLDALARLHARYWQDTRLWSSAVCLMPARASLGLLAPAALERILAAGDRSFYLPLALSGWEAFFALASPNAAARLRDAFSAPEPYLAAITRLPRTLVHGDVWGPNLGWLPPTSRAPRLGQRLLLLDWALATAGPATYDPLWLCGTWHALHPPRVLALYRAHLERRLRARGIVLAPAIWAAMIDGGYLRTALTCGEALGRAAAEAPLGAARRQAEARARWWAQRAARAAERLVPS
jgi:hypothetical protein